MERTKGLVPTICTCLNAYIVVSFEILFMDMLGASINVIVRKFGMKQPLLVRAERSRLPTNDGVEFLGTTECRLCFRLYAVSGPGRISADAGSCAF
jgi:hypothetical protein